MLYPLPSGNSVEPDAVTCVYAVGPILYVGLQFGQTIRAAEYDTEKQALAHAIIYTDEINRRKTPNAAIKP